MRRRQRHGGRNRGYGRRRRRNEGRRSHNHSHEERKKEGIFVSFFKKFFRGGKKQASSERSCRSDYSENNRASSSCSSRPVEVVEVLTPKLYIGNLSYQTSESDLFDLFSQVGSVGNVEIVRDRRSNSKGFGFVEMQNLETAKAAAEKYNGVEFMGRQLVVNGAKS